MSTPDIENSMNISKSKSLEKPLLDAEEVDAESVDDVNMYGDSGHVSFTHTVDTKYEYQPVVDVGTMELIPYIYSHPLPSEQYASICLCIQVFSVVSLLISLHSSNGTDALTASLTTYSYYYMFWCWLVLPLYQNYNIVSVETKRRLDISQGFILFRSAYSFIKYLLGYYQIVPKTDSKDHTVVNYTEDVRINSDSVSSVDTDSVGDRSNPNSDTKTNTLSNARIVPRDMHVRSTRYIPFSIYNYYYMMTHPGKQLNTELPEDQAYFGFGRSILLVLTTSALGALNSYLLIYAFVQFNDNSHNNGISKGFAFVSAILALVGYRVTILSVIFGYILLPYTLGVYVAFFFVDIFNVTNPRKGTCIYNMLLKLWHYAVKFE